MNRTRYAMRADDPRVLFVIQSKVSKLGGIPATYSSAATCPRTCPHLGAGCYAEAGLFTRLAWLRAETAGHRWPDLLASVLKLKSGALWRHNVAGDLPNLNGRVNRRKLTSLARANRKAGAQGFTFTHLQPTPHNAAAFKAANAAGFTVNLSADGLAQADAYASLGVAPVVVTVPTEAPITQRTPQGRLVVVCPQQTNSERVTCRSCRLCSIASRQTIVAFRAHGAGANQVSARAALAVQS